MNKLTKIGATALCGSLAAVSAANAGEMVVKGGATVTHTSLEQETTGNPLGMNSGLTFVGSGELDNGTTFTLTLTDADKSAYSAGSLSMTTPSMGSFTIDQSGGGIDRYDDMMPTAWEETNGTGLSTGLQTVAGVGANTNIEWGVPADMLPDGVSANVAYSFSNSGGAPNDKAVGGDSGKAGSGYDITLAHSGLMDGLNVFGGYSVTEQYKENTDGDRVQKVIGATYAIGSVTVGYQWSHDGQQTSTAAAVSSYENNAYGLSFAVNDDLSLSYGVHKSDQSKQNGTSVELEGSSLQLAYSMGGASIKVAETSVDNGNYNSATDKDATTVALTLAF
jgi:outer membrane protein OmpU